ESESSGAISGAGDGIHAERSHRNLLPAAETIEGGGLSRVLGYHVDYLGPETRSAGTHKTAAASSRKGRTLIAIREMVLRGAFAARRRIEEVELSKSLGAS